MRHTKSFTYILLKMPFFQSSTYMDSIYDSQDILHHRKGLELLPIHNHRIYGKLKSIIRSDSNEKFECLNKMYDLDGLWDAVLMGSCI